MTARMNCDSEERREMKKQKWNAIRVGDTLYKEIKALAKKKDRPMTSILRAIWDKHKKEVTRGL